MLLQYDGTRCRDLARISEAFPLLEQLYVAAPEMMHVTVEPSAWVQLQRLPRLRSLGVAKMVTDADILGIARLKRMERLRMALCHYVTPPGLACVSRLTALTSLKLVACDQITAQVSQRIAHLSRLRKLKLCGCHALGDDGMRHMSRLPLLSSLSLANCDTVTDTGIAHLSRLASLRKLSFFGGDMEDISGRITDASLNHLAHVSGLVSLKLINLPDITDDGVLHLSRLTDLTFLSFEECENVTPASRQFFTHFTGLTVEVPDYEGGYEDEEFDESETDDDQGSDGD